MQCRSEASPLEPRAYAAYSKDDGIRQRGSSGGMFESIAQELLTDGYAVYGAAFDNDFRLKCTVATTTDELSPLLKSKYLQSDMGNSYEKIRERLDAGQGVLFCGTPCQVQALRNFLGKEYKALVTVDFFCHGVPSQRLFDECRRVEEEKLGTHILEYQFRSKPKRAASPHYYTARYEKNGKEKTKTKLYFFSPFYALFQQYITLRESCYSCPFAQDVHSADITIGDFHDIDRYLSGINRFRGVSMVIVNTEKGAMLWEKIREHLYAVDMDLHELKRNGTVFAGATKRPSGRDAFIADAAVMTTEALIRKHAAPRRYIKQRVYYRMPRLLRRLLRYYVS